MKKRILNVGCGADTYGTDFIDLYPTRKNVKKWDMQKEKIPFKDNTFDEVYSHSVLEHCQNPGFFISEIKRVCKKGGKIKIFTDNASHWIYAFDNQTHSGKYEQKGYAFKVADNTEQDRHYMLFTDWHLKNFFEVNNIKITSIKYEYVKRSKTLKGLFLAGIEKLLSKMPFYRMSPYGIWIEGIKI
jgi:SAM-dependent methyltransferase